MKSLSEYKQQLIAKGYNSKKRKQLYEQFIAKQKIRKKNKKNANPYKLQRDNWISQYPLSKLKKYNARSKLRLFYPWTHWDTWHYCLKFVTIPPKFTSFFVQDGNLWTNSVALTKYLGISYEQLLLHVIESKYRPLSTIRYQVPTFSHSLNHSEMLTVTWINLNDLKLLNKLKTFYDYDMKWLAFYDNALDAQEWINSHPWTQTVNNSTISGNGNLREAIHTIAKLESQLSPPIHFNLNHNIVWANSTSHLVTPWDDTYTYFKHRKYLFFEGSC